MELSWKDVDAKRALVHLDALIVRGKTNNECINVCKMKTNKCYLYHMPCIWWKKRYRPFDVKEQLHH